MLPAREVGVPDGPDVSVGGDDPVVLAWVFKIPVAVAFAREVLLEYQANALGLTVRFEPIEAA
ncbi:hypothetical protein [Kitasatospora sp. NPDC094016]|uniref:hypothetical protein n=1 Tax=Kitasatospora sp. NPDC094016 TaxID=3154986 RepID=UPI0033339294